MTEAVDVARTDAPISRPQTQSWFIPPVIIPAIAVCLIVAMATSRALS